MRRVDACMTESRLAFLYRTHGPTIYARCRRLLGDHASAEDATQEAFLRVHRHLDKAPDDAEAQRWIYRIATNYCLNQLRDARRRTVHAPDEPLPDRSIDELLADRDLAERLVSQAEEKIRTPAFLHYVDGLDQSEVGRVLGVSRRTVITWLNKFKEDARRRAKGER